MSAFDAGSVRGSLDLDTTRYDKGFDEAHTHAETSAGRIREVLESVTEVLNAALGPAVEEIGEKLRSMVAGFSEGPIIGGLNAAAIAAGGLREAVADTASEFRTLGLEAQKAGVSVEFMDRFANVASTANIGIEQVGVAFKVLEQRGEEALGPGGEKISRSFEKIGISSAELASLLEDPERLMRRVQDGMNGLGSAAERNAEALAIMGRQGANFIPIFSMSREEFDRTAETYDRLAGVVDAGSAKQGASVTRLEGYFHASWEGIEREVSKPILKYLDEHMDEIVPKIEKATALIKSAIDDAWSLIEGKSISAGGAVGALGEKIEKLKTLFKEIRGDATELGKDFEAVGIVIDAKLGHPVEHLEELFKGLTVDLSVLRPVLDEIKSLFEEMGKALSYVQDQVTGAISKIREMAGIRDELKTGGTAGLTADQARAELEKAGSIDSNAKKQQPGSANTEPTPVPTPAPAPSQSGPAAGPSGASPSATSQDHSEVIQAAATAAVAAVAASTSNPNASPVTTASVTPPPAPSKPKPGYSTVRGELTDAVADDQGMYHVSSSSGKGIGGTLTKEQYDNLRASDKSSRGTDSHTVASPDNKLDSISIWRQSHEQQMDSISERFGRSRSGGNGGGGGAPTYNVTIQQTANPQQTAAELAAKLLPALQKAQKDHDQRAAGAASAAAVASSMGGG